MMPAPAEPRRSPAASQDIWCLYDAGDVEKRAHRWSHETLMLALDAAGTTSWRVTDAGAEVVEFELRAVCGDGQRAVVSYALFTEECELSAARKERIVREVERSLEGGASSITDSARARVKVRAVAKDLGVSSA